MVAASVVLFVVAIVAGNLFFLGLLFWFINWLFGELSGWNRLAKLFACRPPEDVWTITGDSAKVGPIRYRRIVKSGVRPEGLYLKVTGILRHTPLCLPWGELRHPRPATFYRRPCFAVTVGEPPQTELLVSVDLYRLMYPYLAGRPSVVRGKS